MNFEGYSSRPALIRLFVTVTKYLRKQLKGRKDFFFFDATWVEFREEGFN
jgi:hypothetical protein